MLDIPNKPEDLYIMSLSIDELKTLLPSKYENIIQERIKQLETQDVNK